ncbi:MarR family winged helix-turn-helix transcriptional regulator [Kitasatospora sp. GAS204B]|uniref:MarR family winged helix-turn-helix transcriptional regulator n=1 Tax=unclassified Kitasatospora TaxID=2633591 RepID=UPI002475E880|nr:MarR family transcriptional regulator [Kitasatospora sp. GAS204B]MDH6116374.1 DNA-binding MarR family transcriptional regulator [Kitasatospora sp. GAS204B]
MVEDLTGSEAVFRAVEREVAVMFRRGRARSAEMSRMVHPKLEGLAYSLLAHLSEAGQVRVTDVGAHFGVGKATISRQIKALEELGLVARESDPLDGRVSLVSLTEDGARRFLRAHEYRIASFRAMLASWDPAELDQFVHLLARFNETVASVSRREDWDE